MKSFKPILLSLCAVGVVSWVGYSFYQAYQPEPVRLQGMIEAQQYSISSKVPGRIDQVLVRKGENITKGQLVFTLHSPEIEAKLEQAKAGEKAAGALAQEAEKGARSQQIQAAKDQWLKAKAAADLMEKTYQRVNNLYNDGVVAEQKRDEAMTQWQAAKYTESAAFQMYEMAKEGVRDETKLAAAEKARMAAGAVAEVEAYANDTRIESWFDGEVSQVLLQSGELAPQGFPVVTVIDTQDAWAVLNVREDLLKHFQKDQTFSAYLPALDKKIEFKVSHIAVMGDFATWRATDASKGFDLRTFEVEARPVTPAHDLRMGMSLVVEL
ncbi:HlyD family efflux transporter periplasmic adaptor subunit [Vibrio vulnificus]|uniref:HlyD family secretion protein n=1 Tax=Vibrio vulnificus TaxID=672 RepID=UPI00102A663E|nr:efflux RND transporter periplasmic adaptor subunit [Vibrio vulnificus]EGQ7995964.1 HlyD family efflux transporter periplasmic adaptor subunit [Vibrio vulnificus]EGR0127597.1 HlyD family efflux transporter periplasmic adaptor subunit [Vibrio vulnificus]RZP88729.1 HlyD family efflux transporter periplasmic adaptor subunit [Vibrio vulnificus]RZQ08775.1 HlyD family efflux transporter periplasmic adaptor subunit [Vibrio vulnificus]RZQ30425.1 HlyD family efflux transporter periplasmic adaptor sub